MKDKVNDLIPWLEKFLESLVKVNPDDNRGEEITASEVCGVLTGRWMRLECDR